MTIIKKLKAYIFDVYVRNTTTIIYVQIPALDKWYDVIVPMHDVELIVLTLAVIDELDVNNVIEKVVDFFHINFISNLPHEHHASVRKIIREALVEACIEKMVEDSIDNVISGNMVSSENTITH